MKKVLILLLIFSACKKEVYYYPSKDFFDKYNPQEIIIDDLSFQEITDSIRNGLYDDKNLFLKIEESNKTYNVISFADTGGYRRERNGLHIRNDSLDLINGKYPLKDLSKYLKLHYENNDKEYFYASSHKWAYVVLNLERKESSKKLKELLLEVIKTYNETNINFKDSIQFNILLEYPLKGVFPTPPPPPIEIVD
jgi:hypothetical protein